MSDISNEFNNRVKIVCRDAVERASNLADALQACEGLFPTLAVPRFLEIDRARTLRWLEEETASAQLSTSATEHGASFVLSTWDFCEERLEALSSITWESDSRVCLLGTPSLIQHLPAAAEARPHVLIDLRTPATEMAGSVLHLSYDINMLKGCEFAGAFNACFLDPPWYVENYLKWIDIAGSYCCDGGVIAFALLGRLTRPSAVDDRELILRHCRASGLSVELYENFILYEPPLFERHMLRRAGIPPVSWKRADLVIATRNRWNTSLNPAAPPARLMPFKQARLAGLTIEVVFDRYEEDAQKILMIAQGGYWMKTPSRREPGLQGCNVFTSNGARFVSPKPVDLFAKLLSLQGADSSCVREEIGRLGFPLDVFDERSGAYGYALQMDDGVPAISGHRRGRG